jgi:peptidoglycan hydrolase FlgJ
MQSEGPMSHSITFSHEPSPRPAIGHTETSASLHKTSRAFETVLVSQMLQAAGLNKPVEGFGGGIGEEQFTSFLTDLQAQAMVDRGGLGLAQRLFVIMAQKGVSDGA